MYSFRTISVLLAEPCKKRMRIPFDLEAHFEDAAVAVGMASTSNALTTASSSSSSSVVSLLDSSAGIDRAENSEKSATDGLTNASSLHETAAFANPPYESVPRNFAVICTWTALSSTSLKASDSESLWSLYERATKASSVSLSLCRVD